MNTTCLIVALAGALSGITTSDHAPEWKPARGPLATRWASQVDPRKTHPEYPRPQMVRPAWVNLNGLWDYAIHPKDGDRPAAFDGRILVPFPIESALSGVMKPVKPDQRLWYRRTFELASPKQGQRWLLHFGGVDWDSTVIFNGRTLGTHRGGYDPFTFDITEAIAPSGTQELVVSVWDPTDAGSQPHGKQVLKSGGIMYTANTGIWQTVWLEPVPEVRIDSLKIVPDLDAGEVRISVRVAGGKGETQVVAWAFDGDREIAVAHGPASIPLGLKIRDPKPWSPDQPFLYGLRVGIQGGDEVRSYFGMRKIALAKDESGINRLFLNGKPLFQLGPLDQGWWPDGLYTAPTDEALKYDLDITRQLGFNMIRKHVKLERAVYTQTTDCEVEVNGLLTYDRAVIKVPVEAIALAQKILYLPMPTIKVLVPTAETSPQTWSYATKAPDTGWTNPAFDDSTWSKGQSGFGTKGTPGALVHTDWKTNDIWLRRAFELDSKPLHSPQLLIHHDENAEIYVNGKLVANLDSFTTAYQLVPLGPDAVGVFKLGRNVLAVHCHQTGGGQYIDTGLVDFIEKAKTISSATLKRTKAVP